MSPRAGEKASEGGRPVGGDGAQATHERRQRASEGGDGARARTALGFLLLLFFSSSSSSSLFLPQSTANGRNQLPTIDFWRYRLVAGGPHSITAYQHSPHGLHHDRS
ncbi:hypothetical protein GW17_00015663 [Ensete ventricosum]|nr:hypothetical protein GW17_00015663 [Ensete ventricosum]